MNSGKVIWITGLSGAGKTTLAHEVVQCLKETHERVVLLDGDELRSKIKTDSSVEENSKEHRLNLSFQYSTLCKKLADEGNIVVIATISMFKEVYEWNRAHLPGYFEVYLSVPIDVLKERDPKGIYSKYKRGEIKNVAGLDLRTDPPVAHLTILYDEKNSLRDIADKVIREFKGETD